MNYFRANSESDGLARAIAITLEEGCRQGDKIEKLCFLVSVPFEEMAWKKYRNFQQDYVEFSNSLGLHGWQRATRVYTDPRDRPTKPSYLKRLVAFPDRHRRSPQSEVSINQINTIVHKLAAKPGYSLLSFVFLRPADLHDQFRAGYVPCPIAGDFKYRNGQLHLNVMFRTCDLLAVGYADIFYLRQLQLDVLSEAKQITQRSDLSSGVPGDLNLFFGRAYVPARVKLDPNKRGTTSGVTVAKKLIALLDDD